jgi:type VI secretion system protein ImpH
MAGANRKTTNAVTSERLAELEREPYHFDLFAAIRVLECLYPERPRIGYSRRPKEDPVRFGQAPALSFAASTLAAFRTGASAGAAHYMITNHPGLLGPNGPLPLHLTEYARDRLRNAKDPTMVHFLDLFHHRMVSLFYRAWADAQPTNNYDRPDADRFAMYLGTLFGIGSPALQDRDALPDSAKLHFSGRLAAQCRNAEGLEAMIQVYFSLPAQVEPFVGGWLTLPPDSRSHLGSSPETGLLGVNVVIGERVWDCQSRFRIILGALGLVDYQRMLPGSESLTRLIALVLNYVGYELDWELNLVLRHEEAPKLVLGESARLGWTTWLGGEAFTKDLDDLTLQPLQFQTSTKPTAAAEWPNPGE